MKIAVLEERVKNRDHALSIQADEYERRLTDLNHAHSLAAEKNREFVSTLVHDRDIREINAWRTNVDKQLAIAAGGRSAVIAMGSVALSIIAIGLAAIPLLR